MSDPTLKRMSPPVNGTGTSAHIEEFDGLRGLAVLGVMLFHSKDLLGETALGMAARQGWAGVNLFFVLSGFLITSILVRAKGQPLYFRNFYARRALRIWPLYFALLLASWTAALLLPGHAVSQSILATPWIPFALLIQNLFLTSLPGPLLPTWTLAIEEQFYLAWAPMVRFLAGPSILLVALAVIVASPCARYVMEDRLLATNTLLNLDGLAFGAVLALLLNRGTLRAPLAWTFAIAGVAGLCYSGFDASPLLPTFLASVFAGIVALLLVSPSRYRPFRRVLRARWLVGLGIISYGLYLLHGWASIFVSAIGVDRFLGQFGTWGDLGLVAVRLAASITLATVSWIAIEKPALRLKRFFHSGDRQDPRAPLS